MFIYAFVRPASETCEHDWKMTHYQPPDVKRHVCNVCKLVRWTWPDSAEAQPACKWCAGVKPGRRCPMCGRLA